jgi:allophanate hydrolase
MPAIEVIDPGLHTTVQDLGRSGYRNVGVPMSGALDQVSLRLANALVNNPAGTPVLEMLMVGPTLKVTVGSLRVALAGCNAKIEIGAGGSKQVPAGQSIRMVRNEIFRVGSTGDSACAYLAIEGGIDVPSVLGSASTYTRSRIGGYLGRRLQQGDVLPVRLNEVDVHRENAMDRPLDLAFERPIRVVLGPQDDYFTDEAIKIFLSSEYKVSFQSDRMGYRLDGPVVAHAKGADIVSDGIVTGAIQVPGSGKPIVLMVDNPTTGGYPKIATVISTDIPVMARRSPGRTVRFTAIDVHEAQLLFRQQEIAIQQKLNAIRRVQGRFEA